MTTSSLFLPPTAWTLSPSGIENYLTCPRRFFYANQLQIRPPKTPFHSLFGRAAHLVLQHATTPTAQNCSRDVLSSITQTLLTPQPNSNASTTLVEDREWYRFQVDLQSVSRLRRHQLHTQLELTWTSFEDDGGLAELQHQWTVIAREMPLHLSNPLGLNNIKLTGRLDALIQQPNGRLLLVDYKTSRSQYTEAKAQEKFEDAVLRPSEKQRHVQLPLYRLMLKQRPEYAGKSIDIAIQLLRPSLFGGSKRLQITDEQLSNHNPVLHDLLTKSVAHPLERLSQSASEAKFAALGQKSDCLRCDYKSICERGQSLSEDSDDSGLGEATE